MSLHWNVNTDNIYRFTGSFLVVFSDVMCNDEIGKICKDDVFTIIKSSYNPASGNPKRFIIWHGGVGWMFDVGHYEFA